MIDLITNFGQYEKSISKYIGDRVSYYNNSKCKSTLVKRVKRLNSSWDMVVSSKDNTGNSQNYLAQMSYGLVKQQQLARRAIFSNNFRSDPLFSVRAIGNTPQDNAINMQDVLQANNEAIHFRPKILMPGNSNVSKFGSAVVFTEYANRKEYGWRTVVDKLMGTQRKYGAIKDSHNAMCQMVNILNYGQNPDVAECDDSDYRFHIERWSFSNFINKVQSSPNLYIKENVEKLTKRVKKENNVSEYYYDHSGKVNAHDYGSISINDVIRGQFQIHIDGNEDDETYYYIEMIGDTIIRFQDNPYDMNMNQYTTICCERRDEYWWGNTPAEYSIGNENSLNMLLGMSMENAIEGMRKYIFYNKNAISPALWDQTSHSGRIPVDVGKDIALNNLLWTYQVPDTSSQATGDAYARILENDQRFSTSPDLNRPTSAGGPSNKTATAASIMANKGDTNDADLLERLSYDWMRVGEKQTIVLAQFLGNFSPVLVNPAQANTIRYIQKENLIGDFSLTLDTALQQSYQGELVRYQNIISWLQNLVNGGAQVKPDLAPLVRQVLKMGKFLKIDEALPEETPSENGIPQMQASQEMIPQNGEPV